jgi:hypothetical protein
MHNIDVMHQERNVGESILSTCMSFADKTKDNHKARKDLALLFNRPSLELKSHGGKPHAPFCLKARDRKEVLIWLKNLKFPYGYAAGFRRAINLDTGKLSGVKSHDSEEEEEQEPEQEEDEEEEGHYEGEARHYEEEVVGVTDLLQDPHPHADTGLATSFTLL